MKKFFLLLISLSCFSFLVAKTVKVNNQNNSVNLELTNTSKTVIKFNTNNFDAMPVDINGKTYYDIKLKKSINSYEKGMPSLPVISKSLIIGNLAKVKANVINSEYKDYKLAVAPSKGIISRTVNPNDVPFTFNDAYKKNKFYPSKIAKLGKPYIMRDYRGIVLYTSPFSYNPKTNTLRVYHNITIEVKTVGTDTENIKTNINHNFANGFEPFYKNHFINYTNTTRYDEIPDMGRMIILANSSYVSTLEPFVKWKNQKGIKCEVYTEADLDLMRTNEILNFITAKYHSPQGLAYVLLVGDNQQLITPMVSNGAADPVYSLLEGNDSYPEIFIGRFSAENNEQLQTQIDRTIYYEKDIQTNSAWINKAIGIASNQGGTPSNPGNDGESDDQHIDNLRTQLLNYGYSEMDRIYDGLNPTAQAVTNALNEGRSLLYYMGHGLTNSWGTTGYNSRLVKNQLTNVNMLPMIVAGACLNGNFTNRTCFAETWLRATHNNQPTGAIAFYGSSINQEWEPPMEAQDESVNLIVAESKITLGSLWFHSASSMIEDYPQSHLGVKTFKTWNIFGDPSLGIRTKSPEELQVVNETNLIIGANQYTVNVNAVNALVCLSNGNEIIGKAYVGDDFSATLHLNNTPEIPSNLTLTVTGLNKVTTVKTVRLVPSSGAYITASNPVISDGNNNIPEYHDEVNLKFNWKNVGTGNSEDTNITLTTNDEYITILTGETHLGILSMNDTVLQNLPFIVKIANNVPNLHNAEFTLTADDGEGTWISHYTMQIKAPSLELYYSNIDDSESGNNNNGFLDPNETAIMQLTVKNVGDAPVNNSLINVSSNSPEISISQSLNILGAIQPNQTQTINYEATTSNNLNRSEIIPIGLHLSNDIYDFITPVDVLIGSPNENFETATLDLNRWHTSSNFPWTISSATSHSGAQSVVSGNQQQHSTQSALWINIDVATTSTISFYQKTASENGFDKLKFFIDDIEMGNWSGEHEWSLVTFEVSSGVHEFKWAYVKDHLASQAEDSCWLDDIVFPTISSNSQKPILYLPETNLNFGRINQDTIKYFAIKNTGSAELSGNIAVTPPFKILLSSSATGDENTRNFRHETSYTLPVNTSAYVKVLFDEQETSGTNNNFTADISVSSNDDFLPLTTVNVAANYTTTDTTNDVNKFKTALLGNTPNPFNPKTKIEFSLKNDTNVKINVFNIKGQKVVNLCNENVKAGKRTIWWNGKDSNNKSVSSGVYFYKMRTSRYTATKKMILLK